MLHNDTLDAAHAAAVCEWPAIPLTCRPELPELIECRVTPVEYVVRGQFRGDGWPQVVAAARRQGVILQEFDGGCLLSSDRCEGVLMVAPGTSLGGREDPSVVRFTVRSEHASEAKVRVENFVRQLGLPVW